MSCAGCAVGDGKSPKGCGSKGGCSTGGCNRLNTYDWLAGVDLPEHDDFDLIEVSFKNGARKFFFHNPPYIRAMKNDWVVVESGNGYDVGKVSLTGELVKLQMKKKRIRNNSTFHKVIRIANERDLAKLQEARSLEKETMIRARFIAGSLDLNMKVGDVEYQGDKRKATFYYTADGRVDFRELIRHYAREFRVKIEMRQIGARQESARIGGLGSCGRELCCSTWLSDFKSVSTSAARYQNLAINQSKLSGQCGRLKCCLNYELNTYMEALKSFPKDADVLHTEAGTAQLIKLDIFKGLMYYAYRNNSATRGKIFALTVERSKEIRAMNKNKQKPEELMGISLNDEVSDEDADLGFADVTGQIELPEEKRRKKRGRGNRNRGRSGGAKGQGQKKPVTKQGNAKQQKPGTKKEGGNKQGNQNRGPGNKQGGNNKPPQPKKTGDSKDGNNNNPQAKDGNQPNKPSGKGNNNRRNRGRRNNRNKNNGGNKQDPPKS